MALSYAGIGLPLSTPQHQAWLEAVHPQLDFLDWSAWSFEGFGLDRLPTPPWPSPPSPRCGVLYWPTGAVRPAWFHCVVNREILDAIRAAVGEPNGGPQPLVMSDGNPGQTITAQMYMLPARPLNQLGHDASDGWLLTLTDQRFYWGPWKRCTITDRSSWATLYTQLAAALGVPISPDTISPAYQSPSAKWLVTLAPAATVLDAVATQIGQRVVVGLDGSVTTVNYRTAFAASDAQLGDREDGLPLGFVTKGFPVSGGFIDSGATGDIGRYVPAECGVAFYRSTDGTVAQYIRSLADLGVYGYGASVGLSGARGWVYADYPFVPGVNDVEVSEYADQAAYDWYGWRTPDVDVVMAGIAPWVPTGWEDSVEWTYQKRDPRPFASTLVRRGVWDDFVSGSWTGPATSPVPPPPPPVTLQVQTHACLIYGDSSPYPTGIRNEYVTVTLPAGTTVSAPFCEDDPLCCPASECCPDIAISSILYANLQPACGPATNDPLVLIRGAGSDDWTGEGDCSTDTGTVGGPSCTTATGVGVGVSFLVVMGSGQPAQYYVVNVSGGTAYKLTISSSTPVAGATLFYGTDCPAAVLVGSLAGDVTCLDFTPPADGIAVIVVSPNGPAARVTVTLDVGGC